MIDPAIGRSLADLGGFALFMLHLALDAVGLFRQWWVDGGHFREVRDERDALRLEVRAQRLTIDRLTVQLGRERSRRGSDGAAV